MPIYMMTSQSTLYQVECTVSEPALDERGGSPFVQTELDIDTKKALLLWGGGMN